MKTSILDDGVSRSITLNININNTYNSDRMIHTTNLPRVSKARICITKCWSRDAWRTIFENMSDFLGWIQTTWVIVTQSHKCWGCGIALDRLLKWRLVGSRENYKDGCKISRRHVCYLPRAVWLFPSLVGLIYVPQLNPSWKGQNLYTFGSGKQDSKKTDWKCDYKVSSLEANTQRKGIRSVWWETGYNYKAAGNCPIMYSSDRCFMFFV